MTALIRLARYLRQRRSAARPSVDVFTPDGRRAAVIRYGAP